MTTGMAWNEDVPYSNAENSERQMSAATDPLRYVLEQPMVRPAGRVYNYKQLPRSPRRNGLPVELTDGTLLVRYKHLAGALVELVQSGKTPAGTDGVLHHPPEAFEGIEGMAAVGG
jgi:hypothetical protein